MLSQELINAIQQDDFATFATLLRQNPEQINEVDQDGQTLLLYAIKNNKVAFVKELLTYEHLNINQAEPDEPYYSPLFYTITLNRPEIFSLLVTRADVNYTTPRKTTPLFLAVLNGKEDFVTALLQAGAQVNLREGVDNILIMLATNLGFRDIVELLIRFGTNPDQATQVFVSQSILIKKIKQYLRLMQQTQDPTPNGYPPEILNQLIADISPGLCSGLTALWLWYKKHNQDAEFIQTLQTITRWNGEPIAQNLKYSFELIINTVFWLQHASPILEQEQTKLLPGSNSFPIRQPDLHILFDMFTEHKLQKEFSFNFIIQPQELSNILTQVIHDNKMIHLSGLGHAIGIVKDHDSYFLYDANNSSGVISYNNIQDLAAAINQALNPLQINIDLQLNIFDLQGQPIPKYPPADLLIQDLIEQRRDNQLLTPVFILKNHGIKTSFELLLTNHDIQTLNLLLDEYDIKTLIKAKLMPQNPIHFAIQSLATQDEIIAIISKLITKFTIKTMISNNPSLLMHAIAYNRDKIVTFLLQQNADIDAPNADGITPLMYALAKNRREIVTILLQHGADINAPNYDGTTPLMYALAKNHREFVTILLQHGADINTPDSDGTTPLMYALAYNNEEMIDLLLQYGDLNAPNSDDVTPLMYALSYNNDEMFYFLLQHGADINAPNSEGTTPLMYALAYTNPEMIHLLLQQKADVNTPDLNGTTPLMYALAYTNLEMIHLLLQQKADVNTEDCNGETPLMHAILKNNPEIVALLLKYGAKVNYTNSDGVSALTLAQQQGNTEITALLLAAQTLTTSPLLTWQQQLHRQSSSLPPSPSEEMEPPPHITPDH